MINLHVPSITAKPRTVIAANCEIGKSVTCDLTLQNVSLRPRQVRLTKPCGTVWTVSGCPEGAFLLVPGQSLSIHVSYLHQDIESPRHDRILVTSDDGTILNIPCNAAVPSSKIVVSTGEANFGTVPEGTVVSRKLTILNRGPCATSVTALYNAGHLPITVTPMCTHLGPAGSADAEASVAVKIQDAAAGAIAGEVTFVPSDRGPIAKAFVTGLVVAPSYELVDLDGCNVSEVDFGQLYFGDGKSRALLLMNMGCTPLRFCAACGTQSSLAESESMPSQTAPQQQLHASLVKAAQMRARNMQESGSRPFHIEPWEGIVPPQGQMRLVVTFEPSIAVGRQGFSSTYKPQEQQFSYSGQIRFEGVQGVPGRAGRLGKTSSWPCWQARADGRFSKNLHRKNEKGVHVESWTWRNAEWRMS
eukprot:jgi/Botrbrau1/8590/Bobra.0380s0011.1